MICAEAFAVKESEKREARKIFEIGAMTQHNINEVK